MLTLSPAGYTLHLARIGAHVRAWTYLRVAPDVIIPLSVLGETPDEAADLLIAAVARARRDYGPYPTH